MTEKERSDEPAGKLRRILIDPSAPKAAHLMTWTRAGSQVLLEVGYFDLQSIHAQTQPNFVGERVLEWFVVDRFILDLDSAKRIADSLQQLGKHIEEIVNASSEVTATPE